MDTEPDVGTTTQNAITPIGNIFQNGTNVVFDDITTTGINLQSVYDIAACDETALYATVVTGGYFALWFSNSSGQNWIPVGKVMGGPRIACDHAMLANLDASGHMWFVPITSNGPIAKDQNGVEVSWTQASGPTMNRIQGGDGMFYGVHDTVYGNDVYLATNQAIGAGLVWSSSPIGRIGAIEVTGTGATVTGTDAIKPNLPIAWPRAEFALEAAGTIDTNNKLLDGSNSWGTLNTGGERYTTITAASSTMMFGLEWKSDGQHLGRITIHETSCFDGVDDDNDGLIDSEDPDCVPVAATAFCSTHADGDYCSSRYQPLWFLDQANQNTSLTHCSAGVGTLVKPGVCVSTGGNTDFVLNQSQVAQPEQPGEGHYCNVVYGDGSWDFEFVGPTPCDTIAARHPGILGNIVRSGLYSPNGQNNVYVRCTNGSWGPGNSVGTAPLQEARSGVGQQHNQCVFQVSPAELPIFGKMFDYEIGPPRVALPDIHNHSPVDTTQFGDPPANPTGPNGVDVSGANYGQRENAYDIPLDEARALYAPAAGTVLIGGSRIRDVTAAAAGRTGTPNQGELYVQYEVGSDPKYRESFVVYYAHVRRRLVTDGQTVRAGQILGFVGATGSTGGFAHLHVAVFRNSNTNAHTATMLTTGWRQVTTPDTSLSGLNTGGVNAVDPLGWTNPYAPDPGAYFDWGTASSGATPAYVGWGAWSPLLFQRGSAFRYP